MHIVYYESFLSKNRAVDLCCRMVMSYNRFLLINRMFYLSDSESAPARGQPNFDPWSKIRCVLDEMNANFKRYFRPYRLISIGESLVGMKNRCIYIQYLPNKRHARFGIKKFELCDAITGYVQHVELYCGSDFNLNSDEGQATAVVKHLLDVCGLYNKGYHLVTDNFYTRVGLANDLYAKDTLLTGTVRQNSRRFPKSLSAKPNVQSGYYVKKNEIEACAFRDKVTQRKPVCVLSTGIKTKLCKFEKYDRSSVCKPSTILAYNAGMGGVDLMDRKVYHYAAERATHRYWVKIYRNLVDMALRNSYELFSHCFPERRMPCNDYIAHVVESYCAVTEPLPTLNEQVLTHQLMTLPGKSERECKACSTRER